MKDEASPVEVMARARCRLKAQKSASHLPSKKEKDLCWKEVTGFDPKEEDEEQDQSGDQTLLVPTLAGASFTPNDIKLRRLLGEGSGGSVYLGMSRHMNQHIKLAIKVVRKACASDQNENEKYSAHENSFIPQPKVLALRREHAALMLLPPHPHIIPLYSGLLESEDCICYVMKYAANGDLFEYIRRLGRLPESEAWRIFRQVLAAVSHVHAHGLCHRDLKPENIFLDENMNVLLADFGLCARWTSYTPVADCVGSLDYAAPEVLSGSSFVGPEVDMWSLGALLYMMLRGRTPFHALSSADIYENIMRGEYNTADLSDNAANLLSRLLSPDSLRRATMYETLNHPWIKEQPHRTRISSAPSLGSDTSALLLGGAGEDEKKAMTP
ncbi:putative Serine/threonine protein kinase [Balamuthia mandrillaris]